MVSQVNVYVSTGKIDNTRLDFLFGGRVGARFPESLHCFIGSSYLLYRYLYLLQFNGRGAPRFENKALYNVSLFGFYDQQNGKFRIVVFIMNDAKKRDKVEKEGSGLFGYHFPHH